MTSAPSEAADPDAIAGPSHWYVLRGEHQSGPFEHDILVAAFAAGELFSSDFVWREGFAEWVPAADVFGAGAVPISSADAPGAPDRSPAAVAGTGDPIADTETRDHGGEAPKAAETADMPDAAADAAPALFPDPPTAAVEPPEAPLARPAEVIALPPDPDAVAAAEPPPALVPAVDPAEAPTLIHMPGAPPPLPPSAQSGAPPEVAQANEPPAADDPPPLATAAAALGFVSGAPASRPAPGKPRSTYPTEGAAPMWPMPIGPFLSGPWLQRADVVLTRKNRDIKSWLIRFATRGSFSHAAMVFLVPHQERGFNNSFVIESASDGVDLTNFRDLVEDRRSVIGIKRMQAPWFTEEVQAAVRGRLLNSIKSSYNYATILRLAKAFFADVAFGVKSRVYGPGKAIASAHARQVQPPSKFICSGLVQLGFVHTLLDMADQKRLPAEFLSDIVFREDIARFLPKDWNEFTAEEQHDIMWEFATGFADLLEAVTPEDLAASPKLDWVYVIKRGLVYPVSSDTEVRELLTWKPKQRRKG